MKYAADRLKPFEAKRLSARCATREFRRSMRIMTLPVLLMMIMGLAQEPTINNDVDLGQEFKIKNGQEVVVRGEKLRINFVGVVDESRCPTGAVCVWEGNAVVVLDVSKKNKK